MMYNSISTRLERLEHRPQSQIPRFIVEYENGRRGHFSGTDIISHYEGIRRIYYDPQHQASLDAAVIYSMLHGDMVEVVPTNETRHRPQN